MKTTTQINPEWREYEQRVGTCHLDNYGKIYLDQYGVPIDNEYELERLVCQDEESAIE